MNVFSKDQFNQELSCPVDDFVASLRKSLHPIGGYLIPVDSGAKLALARMFYNVAVERREVFVVITGWNVWPSAENLDLFYGYRKYHGEPRILIEAPVHRFHGEIDKAAFVSITSLILYFVWDAEIFDRAGNFLFSTSNDEIVDVYSTESETARFKHLFVQMEMSSVNVPKDRDD